MIDTSTGIFLNEYIHSPFVFPGPKLLNRLFEFTWVPGINIPVFFEPQSKGPCSIVWLPSSSLEQQHMEADSESDRFSLLSGGEGPDLLVVGLLPLPLHSKSLNVLHNTAYKVLQLLASLDTQVMPKYILDHKPLFGPRKSTLYVGSSLLPDLLTLW